MARTRGQAGQVQDCREQELPTTVKKKRVAARMTASLAHPAIEALRRRWNKTRSPDDPDPGPWVLNKELRIITHKTIACKLCNVWLGHFLESVADGDSSLKQARNALDTATHLRWDVEDARRERDEAAESLARVRHELETARDALKQARQNQTAKNDLRSEWGVMVRL